MYNRVCLFAAAGVQDEEFVYPYYRFKENFDLTVVYSGKPELAKCKYGVPIRYDITTKETYHDFFHQFDIFIIPGGWQCPEILRMDELVINAIKWADSNKKIIGAICHGPQVLISAGICKDKKMTAYKGIKDDLINAGATYCDADLVVYDNLVTANHYNANPQFVSGILRSYEFYRLSNYAG